jgi:murein DD-endopeptidase MepM/ murein hydrolase activator NlpD
MKHFVFILLFFFSLIIFSSFTDPNNPYPQGYFQSPVGHSMKLGGSFGELRGNHFHTGIDISPSTRGNSEPIYAAAEGYISRIGIEGGGYGQAIYITHPNGYTTVYGHLDKFTTQITQYVRQKQHEKESFEVDLILQPNEIPVQKGQEIGQMGNRGHSFGKHLHFEVRETAVSKAINPLLFGFYVEDNTPPSIRSLKAYFFNEKKELVGSKTLNINKKDNYYFIIGDTLDVAAAYVGFSVKSIDKQEESGTNGIFKLQMKENDALVYQFSTESVLFSESRYINAHTDFYEHAERNSWFHRAFILPGNHLSMYQNVVNNGLIALGQEAKKVDLISSDVVGNAAVLSLVVRQTQPFLQAYTPPYNYFLPVNEPSIINTEGASFYFPKTSLYDNLFMRFGQTTEVGTYGLYSSTYHIHNPDVPVHSMFTVNIKPINLPEELKPKAFVAYCSGESSKVFNCGGAWSEDGQLMIKNNRFGNYCIMVDQTPPSIKTVDFSQKVYQNSRIAFKIDDNYASMGTAEGIKYRAEVDGIWLMMEFDAKYDLLYHKLDEAKITEGEHTFKLTVTDNRGNQSVFEKNFEYSDEDAPRPVKKSKPKEKSKGKKR